MLDAQRSPLCASLVIKSFADKTTVSIDRRDFVNGHSPQVPQAGLRKLGIVNNAKSMQNPRAAPDSVVEKLNVIG